MYIELAALKLKSFHKEFNYCPQIKRQMLYWSLQKRKQNKKKIVYFITKI